MGYLMAWITLIFELIGAIAFFSTAHLCFVSGRKWGKRAGFIMAFMALLCGINFLGQCQYIDHYFLIEAIKSK